MRSEPKRRPRQTVPQDAEPLTARPSYRCGASEFEAACKAAARPWVQVGRMTPAEKLAALQAWETHVKAISAVYEADRLVCGAEIDSPR